ncbi:MAG: DUF1223 domain-containing protein [Rhodospirillaceae bacterium]|nr:DUF1223 domain-containing protein [Rhodospirillaceae bacterium]MBT5563790.1 DUF1223 domain-containing protein [Rhodospirillaceae bacterium]MBT6241721.1 DUF1223 domain-containing protein [Rhodospirillaceae bacterium]MBT7137294.1 DUF1223 domain-containing protein [Rhodospirillaceae bacterium]
MIYRLKKFSTLIFFIAVSLSLPVSMAVADTDKPLTVVELFTSQGCSSCPPADAYLGELAALDESRGILALSFHVDYWDNLGWKDPYSSAANTSRQRTYAQYMDLRYIYTPQMVVQGTLQGTGSDRQTIARQIKEARKLTTVDVHLQRNGSAVQVLLEDANRQLNADIHMVIYDKEHTTSVKRGENSGKSITNRNVVRSVKKIGSWSGNKTSLSLPLDDSGDACAVIIQSRATGAILGAASITIN